MGYTVDGEPMLGLHLSLATLPRQVTLCAVGVNVHVEALLRTSASCLLQVLLAQSLLECMRCRGVVVPQEELRSDNLSFLVELAHVFVVAQLVSPPSLRAHSFQWAPRLI